MLDVWIYELNFPKGMEINWDNVYSNLMIKHIRIKPCDDEDIREQIKKYSHDINEDDFDGKIPTIYNYTRDDLNAVKGFLDGVANIARNCDYYNFTNAKKYHEYQRELQNLFDAVCWNNGIIPDKEIIELGDVID